MADVSELILKMRADAADVEAGFQKASQQMDQFINKLKTPQVLKISVVTSFTTVGGAVGASKVGQMLYDQADAAQEASTAVEKYGETLSKELTGAYDSISRMMDMQSGNLKNMTMAIFRDSANAVASYSDYMTELIERNAGSWYDFAESVGTAVGWVTKSILSVGATLAWLTESATIILEDLWKSWLEVWERMKAPVTRLYDWAVEKLGWLMDAIKWILNAVSLASPGAGAILSDEARSKLSTSLEALKKGVSGIWEASARAPHKKPAEVGKPAAVKPEKPYDYDEALLRMLKEEVKFYDGVMAGLRGVRDEKNFLIDADQKQLEIERLVGMTEQEYLDRSVYNLEQKVQAQRDLIQARLAWSNVIEAKELDELERQEKLLQLTKKRYEVTEFVRKDPVAGMRKALYDLQDTYAGLGKQMGDMTVATFQRMEDAIVQWVQTGKMSTTDLVNFIEAEMIRLVTRQAILNPFAQWLNQGLGGGGFFGGGGGDLFSMFGGSSGMFFHGGGRVPDDGVRQPVPAGLFMGARRFHSGLAPDEVPAILQKGETVIPKGKRAGGPSVTQNFYITTPNAESFRPAQDQLLRRASRGFRRVNS